MGESRFVSESRIVRSVARAGRVRRIAQRLKKKFVRGVREPPTASNAVRATRTVACRVIVGRRSVGTKKTGTAASGPGSRGLATAKLGYSAA
jgi:hypothetical protein